MKNQPKATIDPNENLIQTIITMVNLFKTAKEQQVYSSISGSFKLFLIFLFFSLTGLVHQVKGQNCSVNAGIPQTICANQPLILQGAYTAPLKNGAQVTWSQIGGPAATIVDPTNLNTQVTNLIGGNTYTFRISTTCLDGTLIYQDVIHTVQLITTANAGPDATYCPGALASLAANAPGTNETGFWTGSGGGVTVNNPTSPTSSLTITGGSSGPVTLRWTITNSLTGCSTYDEAIITNRGGITPVSAGTNQTLGHCYSSTESATLNGSYAGSGIDGQIGTWSVVSGPNVPTIANPNANNTSVTNLIQGTYVFRWTVAGPCDSGTSTVQVIVPAPTANITNASIIGGNQVFCDPTITSTVLSGAVPLYINENILWAQTAGPTLPAGSIVNPTSQVTTVNNLVSPNSYTFSYTINNPVTVCSSSANVSVSYNPNPPTLAITTTNPITLTCGANSATIYFTDGGSGTTQYQLLSGPTTSGIPNFPTSWINAGASPLTISGLTGSGTYQVQMRRITTTGGSCSTPFVGISVVTSDFINAANAGTDQILNCNVTSTDLIGNDPTFGGGIGQGTWSQVSGPSVIILTNPHLPTLGISGLQPNSLYVFRWVISGGPLCPTTQDDVQVFTATSIPTDSYAGPNQTGICFNSSLYLNATPPLYSFEQGTWTVSPNTTGLTISDIHSPKAIVTGLQSTTLYTFTWTVTNGCGSATSSMTADVINVIGSIAANAGTDQCLGSGITSIQLQGNNPSPGTGLWTKISGPPATISSPSVYNTSLSGLTNGVYKFQWAITSNGCSPSLDTVLVTIDPPLQSFNAGPDQQICGSTATLTSSLGAEPGPGTGVWTQVAGSAATIVSPMTYTTSVTGMVSGVYVFRYTVTNGACTASDDISLFISGPPPSIADGGTSPIGVCGTSSVTMNAAAPITGTGLWTIVSGPNTPTIVNPTSPTTSITGLITGSYVFKWTVSGGIYCPSTSANVTVNVTLSADAGSDQSYCDAVTAVNLTGTLASSGTWTQVGTTPNIASINPTSANTAIASGLIPGIYTFQYAISAAGCSTTDQMTVTLYSPPSIAAAGPDQTLCNAPSFTMAATAPTTGTGTWSVLSGPAGYAGSFDNASSNTAIYTPTAGKYGVYIFQWTVSNSTCNNADQVRITNYAPPSPAIAGSNQNVTCATTTTMTATNPAVGLGTWSVVSHSGTGPYPPTITNPLLYNSTITGLGPNADETPDTYTFGWTVSNGNCTSNYQTMTITVHQTPTQANAGPDQSLCNETSVVLAATPVAVGTGTWTSSPGTGITYADAHDPGTVASGLSPGTTYVFHWTSATAFCSSTDDVTIVNSALPTVASVSGTATSYCTLVPIVLSGNTPLVGTGTWTQISGTTLTILSPHSPVTSAIGGTAGNSYGFRWTIGNGACPATSDDVTVTLNTLPSQALAGPDQTLCSPTTTATMAGNTANLPETGLWSWVSGPVTYTITTPTSESTTITGLVPGTYVFRWTHVNGSCTTSDDMQIVVYPSITIANAGPDQTLCNATSFTMAANGVAAGETGTWVRISGPNSPTITSPNSATTSITGTIPGTYVFRWRITDTTCPYTEDLVTVTNRTPISLTGLANSSVCIGGTQAMSVTASGGTGLYNYQWQYNNGTWNNVGTNSNSYTTPVLSTIASYQYRVIVTDQVAADNGGCSTTGTSTVTVVADPAITVQPTNPANICTGGTASMSLTATGGTPTLIYQWQYDTDPGVGVSWSNVVNGTPTGATYTGGTASSMSVSNISGAGSYDYRCIVSASGTDCATVISNTATAVVLADPTLADPVFTINTICAGGTTVVSSSITGGTGTPTYNWQYYNGSSWNNVVNSTPAGTIYTNSTTASMTIAGTSAAGTYQYRLSTTNSSGCDFNSNGVSYIVVTDPTINTQPATPAAICVGGTSANMVIAASGGTPSLNYQWQYNSGTWNAVVDGVPAGAIYSGATGTTFSVSGISVAGPFQYRCLVSATGSDCATATSTVRTLTVVPDPAINSQPGNITICSGSATILSVTATGGTPTLVYQWQSSAVSANSWTNVVGGSGANTASYTTAALNADLDYHVVITATGSDCNSVTSATATVTVNNLISGNIAAAQNICSGAVPAAFTSTTPASGDGAISYQWESSTTSDVAGFSPISAATLETFASGALTQDTWFRRVATSTLNSFPCTATTTAVKVTIYPIPTVTSASSLSICSGLGINYTPTSAVTGTTFTWTAVNTIGTVIGYSPGGNGPINNTLTNTGTGNGQVTYTIIPTGPTPTFCPGPAFQLKVDVINCASKIGVAKQLVSLTNNGDGTFNALFNIRVQNYGNVVLNNIQVTEDLTTAFGALNYAVLGISSTSFSVNTAFTGIGNLLDSSPNNILAVGASTDIRLTVKILSGGSYTNTVTASSSTGSVTDTSQNGSNPDPDGNGNPNDNSVVTPVVTACSPVMNVSLNNAAICYPTSTTYSPVPLVTGVPSTYLWTTDGTGTFDHNNIVNPVYTPSASDIQDGQVVLTLTAYSGPDHLDSANCRCYQCHNLCWKFVCSHWCHGYKILRFDMVNRSGIWHRYF